MYKQKIRNLVTVFAF